MRDMSFRSGTDKGYGLICKNSGCVYNIYTNNLNLVLAHCVDGSLSDYNLIAHPDGSVSVTNGGTTILQNTDNKDYSVGGLVGTNSGRVGSDSITDESVNTICMYNCIVIGGLFRNDIITLFMSAVCVAAVC